MISYWRLFLYFAVIKETMATSRFISTNMIKHYVLENATKHWFSYVKALLVKVTDSNKLNVSDSQNIRNVFKMFSGWVKSFHIKITANRYSFSLETYQVWEGDDRRTKLELGFQVNTIFATALTKIKSAFSASCTCVYWTFHVNIYLKINFTVEYLHILSHNFEKCPQERFTLTDATKPYDFCCFYDCNKPPVQSRTFIFCGKHSDMLFYFKGQYQIGSIWSGLPRYYYISMRYSVMDSLNISMWTNQNYLVQPQRYILLLPDEKILASYHIQVSKLHIVQLHVQTVNITVEIYDGPGILSPKLNKDLTTSAVLLSTTFQVYLFLETQEETLKSNPKNISLFISSVTRHDHQEFINLDPSRHSIVKYPHPNLCNFSTFCSIFITADLHSFINITTTSFMHSGYNSFTCSFGGLSVFDFVNGTYKEITTICKNQDKNYLHRNIYSSTSTAILTFFSSQRYGNRMEVELNVSTTKCKRIVVDACQNNGLSSFDIMFKNVTQQPRIQSKKDHGGNKKAAINCKIIQVVQKGETKIPDSLNYKYQGNTSCTTRVFPTLDTRQNVNITLSVTGFLGFNEFIFSGRIPRILPINSGKYKMSIFSIKTRQNSSHDL